MSEVQLDNPAAFASLFEPRRYKIFYGGRGSGKSWAMARALIALAYTSRLRILCCREYQNSMQDSVKKLLADQIDALGLSAWFKVQDTTITCAITGSEFLFKGLARNIDGIKSTESIDICWVEEAQTISKVSLGILTPTIRATGSELWFSYNPDLETAPMHAFMRSLQGDPGAIVRKVGWKDNPWFSAEMNADRLRTLARDPDAYDHIWGGECLKISEAVIFRNRLEVVDFETPAGVRFHFGADWGFAQDPTVLIRCFVLDEVLHIDHEAFGTGVEMDQIPALFDRVPGSRDWPIKADNARPETISYMANRFGFKISAADKWPGSVEDGVERLKSFRAIRVHPRCEQIAKEFRMYSYKVDRLTSDILPVIVDAWNHGIDAVRYALDGIIRNKRPAMRISPEALAWANRR
nr:PBSX family phage terminase large subunit [uncultured Lichenicoccus sp.]